MVKLSVSENRLYCVLLHKGTFPAALKLENVLFPSVVKNFRKILIQRYYDFIFFMDFINLIIYIYI